MRGNQLPRQWQVIRAIKAGPNGLVLTGIDNRREETGIRKIHRDPEALQARPLAVRDAETQIETKPGDPDHSIKGQFSKAPALITICGFESGKGRDRGEV